MVSSLMTQKDRVSTTLWIDVWSLGAIKSCARKTMHV